MAAGMADLSSVEFDTESELDAESDDLRGIYEDPADESADPNCKDSFDEPEVKATLDSSSDEVAAFLNAAFNGDLSNFCFKLVAAFSVSVILPPALSSVGAACDFPLPLGFTVAFAACDPLPLPMGFTIASASW